MKLLGKTILLVEDEAITALTEKRWLKGEGFDVIHVTSGSSAIDAVQKDPESIDLILMDIDLGFGMDGTEAAREILKNHDIPLLFLSSHTEKEIVDRTEEITSYGYVVKGSDETVLLASMKMAFKLSESKREAQLQETKYSRLAEKLAITLQSIGDGVIATDVQGCITRMNPVAENLCGWNLKEAMGKPLPEVFHIINEKTRRPVENPVNLVLASGKRVGLANHTVLVSKDGKEYNIFDSAAPICDKDHHTSGVVLVFSDVTEQYKKDERLKENEERLRFALEGTNDGLWDVNMKAGEVYLSPRGCEILGYGPDELPEVAKGWSDLVYEEDLPETNRRLEMYLSGKSPLFEVEQRLKTKSGELKWILCRGKAVSFDHLGMPVRITGTHTDISKRKEIEERLHESEEHFKQLFDKAPLGYQSLDENAFFIDVNEAWLDIMGYTREEVLGKWFGDFMTPECKEMVKERFPMFKAMGKVHTEFEMIKKDGTIANIIFDGRIGHKPNGEFKQTHCILQDVTKIRKTERNMSTIEERYRLLFENSMDAIFFASPDGSVISANPAACRLFGMTEEEIIKRGRYGLIDLADPRHKDALKERTENGRFAGELNWIKKDGTKFTGEVSSVVFNDPENQQRTCTIIRDVTGRKLAEEKMRKNNEELIRLNAVKDKSMAIISHDLRGPFQGFLGLTKDLASNIEKMEQQDITEIASVMHQSAKETYSLLTNLQDWSRLQTGRFSFKPVELNLFSEVENLQKLFQSAVVLKSIIMENHVDKDTVIKTDENALSTILRNLIDNAIKFTHEGGKVAVSSRKKENFLEVSVHDSGIGIDSDKLEVLLGSYTGYTTRGTNGEKGSGLGFQLCKDLVEKCGGTISIKSEINNGTEFSFTLPV